MKPYSTEIIRYSIPASKHKDFETAYAEAGEFLKQSPFCLNYQLFRGEEEPDHYVLIINWTSKDDHLTGFRQSEEFKGFFNLVKPFYTDIQEMKHYNITDVSWQRQVMP